MGDCSDSDENDDDDVEEEDDDDDNDLNNDDDNNSDDDDNDDDCDCGEGVDGEGGYFSDRGMIKKSLFVFNFFN